MEKQILELPKHLKRFASEIGRTEHGRAFVEILEEAERQYSNINTIDKDRDANPQIEGRQLMSEMIKELTTLLKPHNNPSKRPGEIDNFE